MIPRTILLVVGFALAAAGGWLVASAFSFSPSGQAEGRLPSPVVVVDPSSSVPSPEASSVARARDTKGRWDAITTAISQARSLSPEQQLAWLKDGTFLHPDPLVAKVFKNELQELLLARDPYGFLAVLATLDPYAFASFQEKLAKRHPEEVFEHVRGLEDPVKQDALLLLAGDWLAEHRPQELQGLVARQAGNRDVQPAVLARLLMKSVSGDPEKLLEMADQEGDLARSLFRSAAAGLMLEKNMDEGLRWLAGETDGEKLFGTISSTAGLTLVQSEDLNRKLARSLAKMDPDFANRILNTGVIFWPGSNIRGAEELWLAADLDRIFSPQVRKEISRRSISELFRQDEQKAIKWLMDEEVVPVAERAEILLWVSRNHGPDRALPRELLSMLDEGTLGAVRPLLEPQPVVEQKTSLLPIREQMALAANSGNGSGFYFKELPAEWSSSQLAEACAYVKEQDQEGLLGLLTRQDHTSKGTVPWALSAEIFRAALEKNVGTKHTLTRVLDLSAEWANSEPAKAAAWVESLPPGQARTFAIKNVAARWTVQSAPEAEQWIAGLKDPAELQAALEAAAIAEEK